MANGTIVDQATYYHDSTTYTGDSGSATNKWVIEDSKDLFNMRNIIPVASFTVYTYFEIVNDIDLNNSNYKTQLTIDLINTVPTGGTGGSYTYIEGNNHSIRNIIIRSNIYLVNGGMSGSRGVTYINNLNFENIIDIGEYTSASGHNYDISYSTIFTNCNFSYYCFESKCRLFVNACQTYDANMTSFTDCTFKVKGYVIPFRWSNYDNNINTISFMSSSNIRITYNRCHIDLDVKVTFRKSQSYANKIINCYSNTYMPYFINTYITGNITYLESHNENNGDVYINNIDLTNSYFAINLDTNNTYIKDSYVNINSYSFYDKDLVNTGTAENDFVSLTPLTTAQATNPDYLLEQGFPVIKVTS